MTIISRTTALLVLGAILAGAGGVPAQSQTRKKTRTEQSASRNKGNGKQNTSRAKKSSGQRAARQQKDTESKASLERRQKATQQEIAETRRKIQENDRAVRRNVNELGKLQGDIDQSRAQVTEYSRKVSLLQKNLDGLNAKISGHEAELARLRSEYLKAVKKMRLKKSSKSTLAFIFSSKSFGEARRRIRYLREFSAWRQRQSEQITSKVTALKQEREEYARNKQMQDRALASQQSAQRALESQYRQKDALVVELKANGAALKDLLARKQAEVNDLRNRVAALIAAEQRAAEQKRLEAERRAEEQRKLELAKAEKEKAEAEKSKSSGPVIADNSDKNKPKTEKPKRQNKSKESTRRRKSKQEAAPVQENRNSPERDNTIASASAAQSGSGFASMRGKLPRPVAGQFRITSRFGQHSLPDLPNVMYDNPGIDAEVAAGATAQAVYSGKVSGVYVIPGFQTVVIVNHGNYYTVYGNLSGAAVKVGDVVKAGQGVGRVAASEDNPSVGQIHFEVWKNRDKQDPAGWIR